MELFWPEWLMYGLVFLSGVMVGSFLNSWMWRTWENMRIVVGRSKCVHCQRTLAWYENIPLFSFLLLWGKCRTCHLKIPAHYPFVECVTGLAFTMVLAYHLQAPVFEGVVFWRDIFFTILLIIIFVYDALYMIILPSIIWLGALVGLVINFFILEESLESLLLGAAIGLGVFLIQFIISRGRWIGGGDVRLGFMMGIWLGFPLILVALLLAYVVGAGVGLALVVGRNKSWQTKIPLGTFLAAGTFAALLYGNPILTWYLHLFG